MESKRNPFLIQQAGVSILRLLCWSERRFAAPFPVTFLILEAVVSVTLAARVLQEERDRLLLPLRVQRAVVPANVEDTFSMM